MNKELQQLIEEYAAMRSEVDPLVKQMKEKEEAIKAAVAELGESVCHAGVKATPRDGSTFDHWDTKGLLDQLERTPWLQKFHEVRSRKGSVAISFNG